MPDQPPPYRTAAEVLDRARALFGLADHELTKGTGVTVDDDHMSRLYRAQTFALVARAGAELAEAMMVAEDAEDAEGLTEAFFGDSPSEELLAALRDRADRDRTGDAG